MKQLHPNLHIFGRTADAELDFVTGMGGRIVNVIPFHRGERQLLGIVFVNREFFRCDGQGVVQTLEFNHIFSRFQSLAFIELALVVHHYFRLVHQCLGLLVIKTVFGE